MIHITLIRGDGIGPEVIHAAKEVIDASGVAIHWEEVEVGKSALEAYHNPLPDHVLESIKKNKVALKGPVTTYVGEGFRSVNVELRKSLDLYANLRPVKKIKGVRSRYDEVDLIIVRENTEDVYAGIEYEISPDIAQSIKVITRKGSERILRFAFSYAQNNGRSKVTAVHKANIMKLSDGLFLKVAREISKEYPQIQYSEEIVDALCMNLVIKPEAYDVLVLPNLYGDIVSDLAAGLVGGLGLVPGGNIGEDIAIFEAVHGSAPNIEGRGVANPTGVILSGCMMLRHIGEREKAKVIENAVNAVLREGVFLTPDLGGQSTTKEFVKGVIQKVSNHKK
jgi:isocitrate dehydrogenase (NAD+)